MKKYLFLLFKWQFILLALLAGMGACKKSDEAGATRPRSSSPVITDTSVHTGNQTNYSFLALGDSYTIGQSVTAPERFPAQTVQRLEQTGKHFAPVKYIATTGWTTNDLIAAINNERLQGTYSVVTLLIGVNDQYQGLDTGGYRTRFTQLLETSIALAGKANHVFVLSIPDYGVTPFASHTGDPARVSKQINEFNSINYSIAMAYHVNYTDITPESRDALHDPRLLAGDDLHPSGSMYAKWVDLLFPQINDVLNK